MRKAIVIAFLRRWLIRRRLAKELFARQMEYHYLAFVHKTPKRMSILRGPLWVDEVLCGSARLLNRGNSPGAANYKEYPEKTASMTKVVVVAGLQTSTRRRVGWHKPMGLLSFVISLNVASMPLKAYLTESFPWQVGQVWSPDAATTFDMYNTETLASKQSYYTASFLHNYVISNIYVDRPNATTFMVAAFEHDSSTPCLTRVVRLPVGIIGALFYGSGIRSVVCNFLANCTAPTMGQCQHVRLLGLPLAEQCVWAVRDHPLAEQETTNVVVYQVMQQWQNQKFLWCKLAYRVVLTVYVCREMYVKYYRHYSTLAANFIDVGLQDPTLTKMEIYIGDPTSIVLSNAWVSLAFVIDYWLSANTVSECILQISQIEDQVLFCKAVLYTCRSVWFSYFMLRYTTFVLKRYNLEHMVTPLDPTLVAVAVLIYAAPMVYLISTTPIMAVQHALWEPLISAAEKGQAIEIFLVLVGVTMAFGAVPLWFSRLWTWCRNRQTKIRGPSQTIVKFSELNLLMFNDIKQRVAFHMFGLQRKFTPSQFEGGSLYALHKHNAKYNRMPLFSHRGSDCFVACYTASGLLKLKCRLSLWRCLDRIERDDDLCVRLCETNHKDCLSRLDGTACMTFQPTGPASQCVHRGVNASPWIL
ncbi:hypothetical protein, variant 2 [Aphanomyces astaci]|uniref:Uncharacterized protein n=1 Tax=Aphanomyces astaci TaxID=112090 RepID=W4GFV3_APHAT|nr:hypothetical protein, variant 2 [Aphanomyces astaci]ETV78547.1 hypothetical protein, variant 2 [Aphanomyces astaci]|eukprot:XP_009832126.1 hypothetical protein, variant 2 [Aphanomyces astaci]